MSGRSKLSEDNLTVHYLQRAPSGIVGLVSVLIALVLLGYGVSEVRRASHNQPALGLVAGAETAADVPVLRLVSGDYFLEGEPVPEGDIVFRLSGEAGRAQGLIIEYPETLSINELTRALDLVNKAGFAHVGLRTISEDSVTTAQ